MRVDEFGVQLAIYFELNLQKVGELKPSSLSRLIFIFYPCRHAVTQSTFADPCTQMLTPALGIDSGFMPVAANATEIPQWSFQVTNASAPLWFFCRQTGHCAKGMVLAVNPTATMSLRTLLLL